MAEANWKSWAFSPYGRRHLTHAPTPGAWAGHATTDEGQRHGTRNCRLPQPDCQLTTAQVSKLVRNVPPVVSFSMNVVAHKHLDTPAQPPGIMSSR